MRVLIEESPSAVTMYDLDSRKSLNDTLDGDFSIFS